MSFEEARLELALASCRAGFIPPDRFAGQRRGKKRRSALFADFWFRLSSFLLSIEVNIFQGWTGRLVFPLF